MKPFRRESDEVTPSGPGEPGLPPVASEQTDFLGMPAIVASRVMRRVMETVQRIAQTDCTVLIAGETGVGKELVARAIHHYSRRSEKPFVDLNCAAFPDNLIESELFGYEKGAFSGADSVKQGMFETAAGGTLFLDEIGELDLRMQPKLLRVLDGQPYYRLGGTRKVQTNARVVAATNADLGEAVQRGSFRADLYHRLDVFQLWVPTLRERVDDIAPLCEMFLRPSGCWLRKDTLQALQSYAWPGNIRELRNAMSKAVTFARGQEITPEDLPAVIQGGGTGGGGTAGGGTAGPGYSLHGIEQETIYKVLEQTGGRQQKAADLLGISRRTLIRKLKAYGSMAAPGGAGRHGHDRASHSSGIRKAGPGVRL